MNYAPAVYRRSFDRDSITFNRSFKFFIHDENFENVYFQGEVNCPIGVCNEFGTVAPPTSTVETTIPETQAVTEVDEFYENGPLY